jgi:hypothetical protein
MASSKDVLHARDTLVDRSIVASVDEVEDPGNIPTRRERSSWN